MKFKNSNIYPLLSLCFIVLIDTMGFGIIFPVLSPIFMKSGGGILPLTASVGIRDAFYALTVGTFSICMFWGGLLLGDLSDQWGRKKILLICLFGTAGSAIICATGIYYGSICLLLLGRGISGLLAGSQSIAQAAIADLSEGTQKTKNLGLVTVASSIGSIIGPIIGGYFSDNTIAPWFTYSTPFAITAILACINGIFLMIIFSETYVTPPGNRRIYLLKGIKIFIQAFKHQSVRKLSLAFLLIETAMCLYFQFVMLYLVAVYHYNSLQLGMFMAYMGIVFAVTLTVVMRIILRVASVTKIVYVGIYISACGYLLPLFIHEIYIEWISVLAILGGNSVAYNALLTIFSNTVSKQQQGWIMGVTSSIIAVSWIFGSIMTGILFYFQQDLPYIAAALITFVGGYIMQFYTGLLRQSDNVLITPK